MSGVNLRTPPNESKWWNPSRQIEHRRITFWSQLLIAVVYYVLYTLVGDYAKASYSHALKDTLLEIRIERDLGVFVEQNIQAYFLHFSYIIKAANLYYVTVHFVLPVVVLVLLFKRDARRFLMYRNVFALLTAIGFVIYLFFPAAPPRLLPASFHFVETQSRYGGAGALDGYLMKEAGDPYGAMPSLHFAWALWCSIAAYRVAKTLAFKAFLIAHPIITIFVVTVTANHLFIDVVAGGVVVVVSQIACGDFGPFRRSWWPKASEGTKGGGKVTLVEGVA